MNAIVKVSPGHSARASVLYCFYGRGKQYFDNIENGTHRAVRYACTMDSPDEFIQYCNAHARGKNRRNELYSVILSVDPTVLDVDDPGHLDRVLGMGVRLAERGYDAEHMVVVHSDAKGGHAHAHILVANHDRTTGKAISRNRSWTHGLSQLNDELLVEAGLTPHLSPFRDKSEWETRRKNFSDGSFERILGDHIHEVLSDLSVVDRESFEKALKSRGVELRETHRDGWSYAMRRVDNNAKGRRKASRLTPEFTAEKVTELFASRVRPATPNDGQSPVVDSPDLDTEMVYQGSPTAVHAPTTAALMDVVVPGLEEYARSRHPRVADSPVELDESPTHAVESPHPISRAPSHKRGRGEGASSHRTSPTPPVPRPPVSQPVVTVTLTRGQMLLDLPWVWGDFLDQAPQRTQAEFVGYVNARCVGVGSVSEVDMPAVFGEFLCDHPEIEHDYDQYGEAVYLAYVREAVLKGNRNPRDSESYLNETVRDKRRRDAAMQHPEALRALRDVRRDMGDLHSQGLFDRER